MPRKLLPCAFAAVAGLIIGGCSTDVDDGGIKETGKVADPAQIKADQKKFMDQMKGSYIKPPGAAAPKAKS